VNARRLALIILLLVLGGCDVLSPDRPVEVPSPDGLHVAIASVNNSQADPTTYRCVRIEIRQLDGAVVYSDQTNASARMRWSLEWLSDDLLLLSSADVGDLYWQRQADGSWQRVAR
jgi:hypothetical protein